MDLIDRQGAIDTLTEYGDGRTVYISVEEAVRRIGQLPSIQPKTVCIAKITLSDEQIQEAVEKAKKKVKNEFYRESQYWLTRKLKEKENDPTYTGKRFDGYKEAILAVKSKLHELHDIYIRGDNET